MSPTDRRLTPGVHHCPGCNKPNIPNRLYACGPCWGRLPRHLQRQITSTVRGSLADRAQALMDASNFYATEETR